VTSPAPPGHGPKDGAGPPRAGRAALLLFGAFVVGVVLLQSSDQPATISTGLTPTTGRQTTGRTVLTTPVVTSTTLPPAHDPKSVRVLVANGSDTKGLGDKVKRRVADAGYDALAAVNGTQKVTSTAVYYNAGFAGDALALAGVLGLPATAAQPLPAQPPVARLGEANLLVLAGPDLAATTTATTTPTATTGHTATTVRRVTTTTTRKAPTTTAPAATTSTP